MEQRRLLVLGGLTTGYHQFDLFAPVFRDLFAEVGFVADTTTDLAALNPENLRRYAAVVNYTTDREIGDREYTALLDFVRAGGGYLGVHCASDTWRNQPDSKRLLGGRFVSHPPQLEIVTEITDLAHPITRGLGSFAVFDELYVMDTAGADWHLLAQSPSYGVQPVAWVRDEGSGRVFYAALGHNRETYTEPTFRTMLGRAALWATRTASVG